MLESKEQKKKILLAVNFADKVEPVSRSSPFRPNKKQVENIDTKLMEIQGLFKIPKSNIIFYSATEEYNLDKIVKGITNILNKTVKTEPTYQEKLKAIYSMTPQDNCGDCECTNCWQFAMQVASKKNSMELSDCPHIVTDDDEDSGSDDDNLLAKMANGLLDGILRLFT